MKWGWESCGVTDTDADRSLNKPSVVVSRPPAAVVDITINITTCVYHRAG